MSDWAVVRDFVLRTMQRAAAFNKIMPDGTRRVKFSLPKEEGRLAYTITYSQPSWVRSMEGLLNEPYAEESWAEALDLGDSLIGEEDDGTKFEITFEPYEIDV